MKKYSSLILFILTCLQTVCAQYMNADSVRKTFEQMRDDTAKVNRMNDFAAAIMSNEPIIAINTMREAARTAQKINYAYGASVAYGLESRMMFYQVKFDSGKLLLDKAYQLLEHSNDKPSVIQKATLIHTYANIYHQRQEYDSALIKYLQAINLFTKVKEENKIFFSYYNISGIYNLLNDTAKAMYYARETQRMARNSTDSNYQMRSLMAMTEAYAGKGVYDSVYAFSKRGIELARSMNNVFGVGKFYTLLGTYYVQKKQQYDTAIVCFKVALDLYTSINIWYDIALVKQLLGNAYLKKGDYTNAILQLKEADEIAQQMKLDQVRLLTLNDLVLAEEKKGNISASYSYLRQYITVKDSVQTRNNRKIVNELEARYQSQKKELLLSTLEKDIRQKRLWIYVFAGTALSLLIISLLSYRTYQQKQRLQQQQIAELEKEKQLLATEAVLKGQEEERTRLAKDLHDGLGGMLSGIRHSFTNIKDNLVLTDENVKAYERSMNMLDSSIKELRTVAHNLMPESLVRFGLDTALKDFCESITGSGTLTVSYHSFGMEALKLEKNTEITLYRVIQELVNNIMKHAQATKALVQLQREEQTLTVTVEDNGKGFNEALLAASKGIGWSNIKNRVEYLKGTVTIESEEGKGTGITIELPVTS